MQMQVHAFFSTRNVCIQLVSGLTHKRVNRVVTYCLCLVERLTAVSRLAAC